MEFDFREIIEELDNLLKLFSYPIQGLLAVMRLCNRDEYTDTDFLRRLSGCGSISRKLSMFASAASETERTCILSEFPYLRMHQNSENRLLLQLGKEKGASETTDDGCNHKKAKREEVFTIDRVVDATNTAASNLSFISYSESSIWTKQQQFYENRGAKAWDRGEVPHQISSNSFVADMYVTMIIQMADKHVHNQHQERMGLKMSNHKNINNDNNGSGSSSSSNNRNSDESYCESNNTNNEDSDISKNLYSGTSNSTERTNNNCIEQKRLRVAVVEVGAGHGLLSLLMARKLKTSLANNKNCSTFSCSKIRENDGAKDGSDSNNDNGSSSYDENNDFDVTVVCTDFHRNIFDDLMILPWVR